MGGGGIDMSRKYSPNHPAVKSWERSLDIRTRTQLVRDRMGHNPRQMNYKARTFSGFVFCLGSFFTMESSYLVSLVLMGMAGWCWVSSVNEYTR
jgi:hypothetical protein